MRKISNNMMLNRHKLLVSLYSTLFKKSYEVKKQDKRIQKEVQIFKFQKEKLIARTLDAQMLVPNFFTDKINLLSFPKLQMPSKDTNHFLNSYACFAFPLSINMNLRQKLDRLNQKDVRIGRLFEIMDSMAGLVSYSHCFGNLGHWRQSPFICVTGSIEQTFLFDKVYIDQDFMVQGYLNYVGRTSMEIQINVLQENKLKVNSCFTMIARNALDPTKGYQIPQLSFQNLTDQTKKVALLRYQHSKNNVIRRKKQMQNSYDRKPPTAAQISVIHSMFLKRKLQLKSQLSSSIPIAQTLISNFQIMHSQRRNVHGKIFGGFLVKQMVELAWVCACKYGQEHMTIYDLANIYFKNPVDVGCRLTLRSMITYAQQNRLVITVQAFTAKFSQSQQTLACTLQMVAKGTKKLKPVHPQSYQETLFYLHSQKSLKQLFDQLPTQS